MCVEEGAKGGWGREDIDVNKKKEARREMEKGARLTTVKYRQPAKNSCGGHRCVGYSSVAMFMMTILFAPLYSTK
jgi:hypothetical protein